MNENEETGPQPFNPMPKIEKPDILTYTDLYILQQFLAKGTRSGLFINEEKINLVVVARKIDTIIKKIIDKNKT